MKNILWQMGRGDKGWSENETPKKISRHQKYTIDDSRDNRETMRFIGGFITVENKTCNNLTEEDNISPLFQPKVWIKIANMWTPHTIKLEENHGPENHG